MKNYRISPINYDTIFPALGNGERIVRRFTSHLVGQGVKCVTILTTHRLLIRSKQTICCVGRQSSYTAISLESIHRIDESHAHTNTGLYLILWIFWFFAALAGTLLSIFLANDQMVRIVGITLSVVTLVIITIIIFISSYCCCKRKMIRLQGTFGTRNLFFTKEQARLFEINLSEHISQSKIHHRISVVPTYYLKNETYQANETMITSSRF